MKPHDSKCKLLILFYTLDLHNTWTYPFFVWTEMEQKNIEKKS